MNDITDVFLYAMKSFPLYSIRSIYFKSMPHSDENLRPSRYFIIHLQAFLPDKHFRQVGARQRYGASNLHHGDGRTVFIRVLLPARPEA